VDKVDLRKPNVVTLVDAATFGRDWMTWNTAGDREGWTEEGDSCSEQLLITELLAEQVEAADTLLVNKCDLVKGGEQRQVEDMVKGLNGKARIFKSEFGNAPVVEILKSGGGREKEKELGEGGGCGDPTCSKPGCGDTGHSHTHSHDHEDGAKEEMPVLSAITSFTYKAERPFNLERLLGILNTWPVPTKDTFDLEAVSKYRSQEAKMPDGRKISNPFISILRSKGFVWIAPVEWGGETEDSWRHDAAMYWSHAGKHFGINQAGKWWGTLEKEEIYRFLEGREGEAERVFREDWKNDEFGDRRQEIVFIGVNYDEDKIREALDGALLDGEEWERYKEKAKERGEGVVNVL
jgi:G3E family GTPase